MKSISGFISEFTTVMRNGVKKSIASKNLVPGDLIFVSNGDKVGADAKIISIEKNCGLSFDRSILTGKLEQPELLNKWKNKFEVLFNSRNKFMTRLFQDKQSGSKSGLLMIKGVPDILLPKCSKTFDYNSNEIEFINKGHEGNIRSIQAKCASNGERVVLLGSKFIPNVDQFINSLFTFQEIEQELIKKCNTGLVFNGFH